MINYTVKPIKKEESYVWLLDKHYAHRIPPMAYVYGLYDNTSTLLGCCVFGYPCRKLQEYWGNILELVRLVVEEGCEKNTLSFFVAESLKMLPRPLTVVSYADDNVGHKGYIYQATNWIYTGLSSSEKKIFIEGKLIHRRSLNSVYGTSSVSELCKKYKIETEEQTGKHRYFMFLGTKKQKKELKDKLPYEVIKYPKGDNNRYDCGGKVAVQSLLF
jgi:hypothetical protein